MLDYKTLIIQGDISRNDARVLIELCTDKTVVEFGVGGSTIILSQCARKVISYDTDESWITRTKDRIKSQNVEFIHSPAIPETIPECDILFIDGLGDQREGWLKHFPKCKTLICHDSLGDTGRGPTIYHVMSKLFLDHVNHLGTAHYHYLDSNMAVIYKRDNPIYFQNWNETERELRRQP